MRLNSFLIILSVLFGFTLFGQGSVSLTIVDEVNKPVEYARFTIYKVRDSSAVTGGYSNEKGLVEIDRIPFGIYYGQLSFFGYEEMYIDNIRLNESQPNLILKDVQLALSMSQEFEEIIIRGESTSLMERSIDKRTYNVEEDMTSMGGSLNDILNNIPSVEVDQDGNVSLRGSGSVTILIDGRESVLSSGDGALDGIPASAIERIEVVTNPSARYNPDGTAGIINIILKKKRLKGVNLDASITAASEHLYNGSLNFNFRNENLNFYASYSMRYREGSRNNYNKRWTEHDDSSEFLQQDRVGSDLERSHTAKIGTDFFIDTNQVLGIAISGGINDRNRSGLQVNNRYFDDVLTEVWERDAYEPARRMSMDINLDYKLDFRDGKGNLMLAAMESFGERVMDANFDELHFAPDGLPLPNTYSFQNQNQFNKNNRFTFNADLERHVNEKIKYETGLQAVIYRMNSRNALTYFDTITQEVSNDLNADNEMLYDENIFSAYGTFGHVVTDYFSYQAGMRLEQAFSNPKILATNEKFNNNYFSFFPSLHILLGTEKMGEFFISYSRRINRARPWWLNPFPVYSDPLNLRVGNPGLMPEYINSYEVGYEKNWKNFGLTSTIFFKQTEGKIQRIREFRDDGVSIMTFANIDKSYEYGLEVIGSYSPFPWWRNMFSINAYESRVSAEINGNMLSNRGISWSAKLNSTFSFWDNTTRFQINAQYVAPRYMVQGIFVWQPGIDVGMTRSLLNKTLEIGVKVSDIFNQQSFYSETTQGKTYQESNFKWSSRRLYLTLSYKFRNITAGDKAVERDIRAPQLEPMDD